MITILVTIIAWALYGLVAFPASFILGEAWKAIALNFNLPMFDYWQMYFITWALFILSPSSGGTVDKLKNDKD